MHPQATAFEQALALHCAPTLSGVAPANLVSLSLCAYSNLSSLLQSYGTQLEEIGVTLFPLCQCKRRLLLLVYRPSLLMEHLSPDQVSAFLAQDGYPVQGSLMDLLCHLRNRMIRTDTFPHEIGFFLGYPLADVLGFLTLGGRNCKLSGYWKVYGDVDYAKSRFEDYDRCRAALSQGLQVGLPLLQLLKKSPHRAA